MMQKNKNYWLIGGLALVILLLCICITAAVTWVTFIRINSNTTIYPTNVPVEIEPFVLPTLTLESNLSLPTATPLKRDDVKPAPVRVPSPTPQSFEKVSSETLDTLANTLVPINDPLDLAARLNGLVGIPRTIAPPAIPFEIGGRKKFWISNIDTHKNKEIDAKLVYETEHLYFWVEDGVNYDEKSLEELADTFENDIYPTDRSFFGSEWTPGVDGDPRLYILYASDLGSDLAGYFSSIDEYPSVVFNYSNAVEIFFLNADNIGLQEPFTYGVLAHEFQHMIHWNQDLNEDSWLNEGLSELAAFINGYYESGFDWLFIQDPDLQLNVWPNDPDQTKPHYGSGFLFVTYLLERFGTQTVQSIIAHPENGLTSIDLTLNELGIKDPLTGSDITADDVFIDWVVTNYLHDGSISDGRFTYNLDQSAPQAQNTEEFNSCPVSPQERTVSQYGADYISFTCPGDYTLHFQGVPEVSVLPADPHSGSYAFWSNRGDESDMTLTQELDFSTYEGPLTLKYWTWYDLEQDYDYVYLESSLDGVTWNILTTPSGTALNTSGSSYGWGYNGVSGGKINPTWIQEAIDISQFAGQKVQIRFEYVTDAAVNGEGMLLDDIEIPEIGYFSNLEQNDGGWEAAGWARIQNVLPQAYRLVLIYKGDRTDVESIDLANGIVDIPIHIGKEKDEVVLVVTGITRFTLQPALYEIELSQK